MAATIVGLGIAAGLWFTANRGTAERSDGIPAVARVLRADDGSCIVGAKRHHCYRLSFEVLPEGEPPFLSHLDVNVPDRWASRIQPGSLVWVVRDRESPRRFTGARGVRRAAAHAKVRRDVSQRNPAAEIATQAGFGAGYVSDRDAGQGLCACGERTQRRWPR